LVGEGAAAIPPLGAPLMLPNETDAAFFNPGVELPYNGSFYVNEEKQVDQLFIHNVDVRGNKETVGTLTSNQLSGTLILLRETLPCWLVVVFSTTNTHIFALQE